jgi:hypothetical protein
MSDQSFEELLNNLSPEENVEIDWDAPEAGQFPPIAPPGVYDFVFRLRQDTPFDSVQIEGQKYLSVIFDADVQVDGETKTVTYQRVNDYKHPKVAISSADELGRSLNLRYEGTHRARMEAFQGASGRARGKAELAWRFYDKNADVTYSTSPRKRKNKAGVKVKDQPWPRNADGTFATTVTDSTGRKQYGQAELIRFFSPSASADAVGA